MKKISCKSSGNLLVNEFDDISNKEKFKRIISNQIKQALPLTITDDADLVHFISAKDQIDFFSSNGNALEELKKLQNSLYSFLIEKRVKSFPIFLNLPS